jgi:hypothetical protein
VIEDNARLFGKYCGRLLGTLGVLATQSFHETKNFNWRGRCAPRQRRLGVERRDPKREGGGLEPFPPRARAQIRVGRPRIELSSVRPPRRLPPRAARGARRIQGRRWRSGIAMRASSRAGRRSRRRAPDRAGALRAAGTSGYADAVDRCARAFIRHLEGAASRRSSIISRCTPSMAGSEGARATARSLRRSLRDCPPPALQPPDAEC